MKSQMASPTFTHVFAALVAVVNTKFPELGELLLKRIILQLRRAFKRNDKQVLLAAAKFVAHLVNQQVAQEIISLELLTLLLEKPTDDSVEVSLIATKCAFTVILVLRTYMTMSWMCFIAPLYVKPHIFCILLMQVAVGFIKEVGSLLQDVSPQGLHSMYPTYPIYSIWSE